VAELRRADFDAMEFDAACTGDHRAAAERMSELAETATQSESMRRAEAFVLAGEQWLLADDPAAAAYRFRLAIADGTPVSSDPRVPLARALFQLGESPEALALIVALKEDGVTSPRLCEQLAELLLEQSDLPAALEWATAGIELILRTPGGRPLSPQVPGPRDAGLEAQNPARQPGREPGPELDSLLRLRYRIRNDLRLPEDEYDRMLDA
jgi:hypothetical protein